MALVVEHEKRKHEILAKAIDVFIEDGYADVTFQKIASRCGITRTTLYIYFKNKREIFLWSIKELLFGIEQSLNEEILNLKISASEKLRKMFFKILQVCQENKKLFSVLLSYLMELQKSNVSPKDRVRRRVVRLRHTISTLIIQCIKDGEFKKNLDVKATNDLLYGLVETSIFHLAVLGEDDVSNIMPSIELAIDGLRLPQ